MLTSWFTSPRCAYFHLHAPEDCQGFLDSTTGMAAEASGAPGAPGGRWSVAAPGRRWSLAGAVPAGYRVHRGATSGVGAGPSGRGAQVGTAGAAPARGAGALGTGS